MLWIKAYSKFKCSPRIKKEQPAYLPFRFPLALGVAELWFGVTFDPMEEELSWQPACPVDVVVSLCQMGAEGVCQDLPHAAKATRYSKVSLAHWPPYFRVVTSLAVVFESPNLIGCYV